MSSSRPAITAAELDALIEEATVDCYNEAEQITGLFTMIEDHLALPFQSTVLGMTVTVAKVDLTVNDEIVAICRRDDHKQAIRSSSCRCRRPRPMARNGSRHTAAGTAEHPGSHQPSRSRICCTRTREIPNRRAITATPAPCWRIRTSSLSRSEIARAGGSASTSIGSVERTDRSRSACAMSATAFGPIIGISKSRVSGVTRRSPTVAIPMRCSAFSHHQRRIDRSNASWSAIDSTRIPAMMTDIPPRRRTGPAERYP
jgi:hypothetical protein